MLCCLCVWVGGVCVIKCTRVSKCCQVHEGVCEQACVGELGGVFVHL